jgi:hypothetical protein
MAQLDSANIKTAEEFADESLNMERLLRRSRLCLDRYFSENVDPNNRFSQNDLKWCNGIAIVREKKMTRESIIKGPDGVLLANVNGKWSSPCAIVCDITSDAADRTFSEGGFARIDHILLLLSKDHINNLKVNGKTDILENYKEVDVGEFRGRAYGATGQNLLLKGITIAVAQDSNQAFYGSNVMISDILNNLITMPAINEDYNRIVSLLEDFMDGKIVYPTSTISMSQTQPTESNAETKVIREQVA